MPIGDNLDLSVNTIVTTTSNAVVAATVLWIYSIIKLYVGTSPAGHNGQFGQVKPAPEALTYPPMKISVKSGHRLATDRVFSNIRFALH
ncbi:MAG: hypothetical protein WBE68_18805 [Candidatus Nitrosopolaris sp.]